LRRHRVAQDALGVDESQLAVDRRLLGAEGKRR
jgi:hypothetical protein